MADALLERARDLAEGQIDFEGQKLADHIVSGFLVATGFLAFVAGYLLQDIKLVIYLGLSGTAAAFLVVVPPWPFYKKNPVQWYEAPGTENVGGGLGAYK